MAEGYSFKTLYDHWARQHVGKKLHVWSDCPEGYTAWEFRGCYWSEHATEYIKEAIAQGEAVGNPPDIIYGDEDYYDDEQNLFHSPMMKSDWAPETFLEQGYLGNVVLYREGFLREQAERIAYWEEQLRPQVQELLTEYNPSPLPEEQMWKYLWPEANILHIPHVLAHSMLTPDPIYEQRIKDLYPGVGREHLSTSPLVSIILLSKDNPHLLPMCLGSIRERTTYPNYEIVLVDNGSSAEHKLEYDKLCAQYGVNYIYEPQEFNFAAMCNIGAKAAKGEFLLFLNDDMEVLAPATSAEAETAAPDWLTSMMSLATRSHVGAVGAKLLYPDSNLIQHMGIIVTKQGAVHACMGMDDRQSLADGRNKRICNYLAVTGACLLVNKDKFWQVGGFDEKFTICYNDVDLCASLYEAGYHNVVAPDAKLYHYESLTRGKDVSEEKKQRLIAERKLWEEKHPAVAQRDPYYNPNLTQEGTDFSICWDDIPCECQISPISHGKEFATDMIGAVDRTEWHKGEVYFKGWMTVPEHENNNALEMKLILYSPSNLLFRKNTSYEISVRRMHRPEILAAYAELNPAKKSLANIERCGFEADFSLEYIRSGSYSVGVRMGDRTVLFPNLTLTVPQHR